LRWKLSFAVYCSANVQQKTIGLTHSNRAALALFLGCQPSSKIPHQIKSTQARFFTTVMTDRLPCLVITKIFLTLPSISRMLLAL
jgi:hypothetical protein